MTDPRPTSGHRSGTTILPISVAVLTKDEEVALPDCLASLRSFDDVFVVDSGSTDGTRAVAEEHGATVVDFVWDHEYPKKKQWSLDRLPFRYEHVLLLDADERLTDSLVGELSALAGSGGLDELDAADIKLDYRFCGRTLRFGHRVVKRALVRRSAVHFPVVPDLAVTHMWEVEGHYQPAVEGTTTRLTGSIVHEDPDGIYDYIARHNRYSDWEAWLASDARASRVVSSVRRGRAAQLVRLPGKPVLFFLYCYLLRLGFLDGRPGLDYAVFQAFYYWQVDLKRRELHRSATRG